MIANLKPYPAMMHSGVEWLGEVPEHWNVRRLKYLLRECDARSSDGNEQLLRVSQFTGVTERRTKDGTNEPDTRAASLVGYKSVNPDELVVNIMLAWNGSMGVSAYTGICSPAYCVYRFHDSALPWYFHTLLRSPVYKARIKAVSTGVVESRLRLYTDDLYCLEGLLPPRPEQSAIVRFIEYVDRRIRRYIRAKQQLIKLLEEQKQAIIHDAFTGTRSSVWKAFPIWAVMCPIKRLGHQDKPLLSLFRDYGVIPKASRDNKNVDVRDLAFCQLVQAGDVVMNKMKAWQGSIAVSDIDGIVSPDYMVLRVIKDLVYPRFLHHLLRSPAMIAEYRRNAYGVRPGQWRLMHDEFRQLKLHIPPTKEQEKIACWIDEVLPRVTATADGLRREIELLNEYRTRLITDVVTGKLDVREAAASLPDEPEESESADDLDEMIEAEMDQADDQDDQAYDDD